MINIQTHNGVFHADEVFACAILRVVHGGDVKIHRSRDELEGMDFIVDVGRVYDPAKGRFDHHQRDFSMTRHDGAGYASAGLVMKEFAGRLALALGVHLAAVLDFEDTIIRRIDQRDIGQVTPESWEVSSQVSDFNPPWDSTYANADAYFMRAVDFAEGVMRRSIERADSRYRAKDVLKNEAVVDGNVTRLPMWIPTSKGDVKTDWLAFEQAGSWRAVRQREELMPPEAWLGLSGDELVEASGVAGAVFVHRAGFMIINETYEGLVQMIGHCGG